MSRSTLQKCRNCDTIFDIGRIKEIHFTFDNQYQISNFIERFNEGYISQCMFCEKGELMNYDRCEHNTNEIKLTVSNLDNIKEQLQPLVDEMHKKVMSDLLEFLNVRNEEFSTIVNNNNNKEHLVSYNPSDI